MRRKEPKNTSTIILGKSHSLRDNYKNTTQNERVRRHYLRINVLRCDSVIRLRDIRVVTYESYAVICIFLFPLCMMHDYGK